MYFPAAFLCLFSVLERRASCYGLCYYACAFVSYKCEALEPL